MTNLLKETLQAIENSNHTSDDIRYIGSREGWSCSWGEFSRLADVHYDSGYGGQEVADDLEIHFTDGSWLERGEYDGSEWWQFRSPLLSLPVETRQIERLVRGVGHYWSDLARLHEEEE